MGKCGNQILHGNERLNPTSRGLAATTEVMERLARRLLDQEEDQTPNLSMTLSGRRGFYMGPPRN
jgi:hypothetical protein